MPASNHPAATSRSPRADSAATRERLLHSSLRLFSERGYEGTSVRAITDDAGVNLAAANYHFGSKQQLLQATFQAALAPINTERLRQLRTLQASDSPPDLTAIVRAFVEPVFLVSQHQYLPKLLANVFAESKEVAVPLLESTFGPTVEEFLRAFARVLPNVSAEDLQWRVHLMVGAMLQLAHFDRPLFPAGKASKRKRATENVTAGLEQLVGFAVAGLQQGSDA